MIFNSYDPENFFKAKFNDIDLLISTSSQVITSTPITDSPVPTFLMTRIGRAGKSMLLLRNQRKVDDNGWKSLDLFMKIDGLLWNWTVKELEFEFHTDPLRPFTFRPVKVFTKGPFIFDNLKINHRWFWVVYSQTVILNTIDNAWTTLVTKSRYGPRRFVFFLFPSVFPCFSAILIRL